MRDKLFLLAALWHRDLDLEACLYRQRVGEQAAFLDVVGQQNQSGRRLVVVELREERRQHLLRREGLLGARETGAIARVLAGAEEEHLDAGIAALLMDGENIGFLDRARVDALLRLDRRQRGKTIAVEGGGLELQFVGGLLHFVRELLLHKIAAAGEEIS